jgi:hypothetical protein
MTEEYKFDTIRRILFLQEVSDLVLENQFLLTCALLVLFS